MQKYRERHAIGACCLCVGTVCVETSYISLDDCFAAFCQSGLAFAAPKEHQYYNTKPPWANTAVSLESIRDDRGWLIELKELSAAKREASTAIRVGMGKMREWRWLDAADSGGGIAESGRR